MSTVCSPQRADDLAMAFVSAQADALDAGLASAVPGPKSYFCRMAIAAGAERGLTPVQALFDQGLEQEAMQAVWAHMGIDVISASTTDLDLAAFSTWTLDLARSFMAVPLLGSKMVAADPTDAGLVSAVRAHLGPNVSLVACANTADLADLLTWAADRVVVKDLATAAAVAASSSGPAVFVEEATASDSEVAQLVDEVLRRAIERKASDVHIEPRRSSLAVRYRVDGVLDGQEYPRDIGPAVVSRLKIMAHVDIAQSRKPADGRFSLPRPGGAVDCRLVTLPSVWGESATVRLLDQSSEVVGIDGLGLSEHLASQLKALAKMPSGALLVTGPTGSGKTTTLYALLAAISSPDRKILTIEDPVEYRVEGVSQHQVNTVAGFSFASALRSFLRADPDVIMVGEIRDTETAEIAISAAYTGHLVLSSFHASSVALAPLRLVEMGITPALVAAGVSAVLGQRLVRCLCQSCKVRDDASYPDMAWPGGAPEEIWAANPNGCTHCALSGRNGYRGRAAIGELLDVDDQVRRVIVAGANPDDIRSEMARQGAPVMWADGLERVRQGVTSMAELARATKEKG